MIKAWFVPSCLLVSGGLFFPSVYHITKYGLMRHGGCKLTKGDIYLISEKVTCSVQAVMCVCTGAIIVSQVKDIMTDTHWLTKPYAWFGLPYMVYDVWAFYQTFYWTSGPGVQALSFWQRLAAFVQHRFLMLVHHLILPVFLFPIIVSWRGDRGDFFVGSYYLVEVTVPFLSLTHILSQLQMKDTRLYTINGLCVLATFFCSRILIFPYLYWSYAAYAGIGLLQVPSSIPIKCNLGCLVVLLPQLYWFRLIFLHAFKFVRFKQ